MFQLPPSTTDEILYRRKVLAVDIHRFPKLVSRVVQKVGS